MLKITTIVAVLVFVGLASLCRPTFFADNELLDQLVSHELLALLAVILTITFASVANIHLTINRIIARAFSDVQAGVGSAAPVRQELNENAWVLFFAFSLNILLLLAKGWWGADVYVRSIANGGGLGILILNILILADIYRVVFKLVTSEFALSEERPPANDGEGPLAG